MLQFGMARIRVIIVRGEDEEYKGMSLKKCSFEGGTLEQYCKLCGWFKINYMI
jgi:hypothetical protein